MALTSSDAPLSLTSADGQAVPLEQVRWRCGQEQELQPVLERCDVLVVNHGFNSHADRSAEAVLRSLEVNALSSWRLLELFAGIANGDPARPVARELWMNTSEAEIQAAVSPLSTRSANGCRASC